MRVVVVGAGVVGLSSALCVKRLLPEAEVTIVAEHFGPETTSAGAAGIFRPTGSKVPGVDSGALRRWCLNSWCHFSSLALSEDAGTAGISFISGHMVYDKPKQSPLLKDFVKNYRDLTRKEIDEICTCSARSYKCGVFFTTLQVECAAYLPYLTEKLRLLGVSFERRRLESLLDVSHGFDVIVNCTGLGSQRLLGDRQLVPVRGQIFRVKAPWIKHFLYTGGSTYIVPCKDNVVVGGVKQEGLDSLSVNPIDSERIWKDALESMPSLKNAEVICEWVGLRPFRKPLRLEKEIVTSSGSPIKVVHNYGHGAEGVGLSWGTAEEAAQLVAKLIAASQL